jgi:ribosomal protein L22
MSPKNPQDPQKGKPDEAKVAEDAAAAKAEQAETPAQPEPSVSETEAAPQAQGTAAAETGVDKLAADVEARADAEQPLAASGDDDPAAGGDEAEAEEVSAEAAEDPGVAAPEAPEDRVVPEKPKRARATQTGEAAPAKEAKPARRRDEPRQVPVGVTVRAQAKYVRTSARKARLVCDHIRGKDVAEARAILAFTPRGAAKAWSKLLESAVANAEHNHELVGEDLRILSVHADEGPTLKRFRPRAMGRATRIRKRTSHLTIQLTPKD